MELKNDVALTGTLHSVDQYLNIKLNDVNVVDAEKYPQLVRRKFQGDGADPSCLTARCLRAAPRRARRPPAARQPALPHAHSPSLRCCRPRTRPLPPPTAFDQELLYPRIGGALRADPRTRG